MSFWEAVGRIQARGGLTGLGTGVVNEERRGLWEAVSDMKQRQEFRQETIMAWTGLMSEDGEQ